MRARKEPALVFLVHRTRRLGRNEKHSLGIHTTCERAIERPEAAKRAHFGRLTRTSAQFDRPPPLNLKPLEHTAITRVFRRGASLAPRTAVPAAPPTPL